MLNELYRQSTSFEEFYKLASEKLDVFNKTWQQIEHQTATLISASTENYNRLMSKVHLFPYWEYKTVGDDKVRPEHAKLHGVILPANDPRWRKIWPPNGWKCRCYVVGRMPHEVAGVNFDEMRARVDAYFDTPEWKQNEAQGFGVNRAMLPEVFTENQMYIKKFANQSAKHLANLNYNTYKLGSYEANRAKATAAVHKYTGTIDEFLSVLKTEDNRIFFTDYNERAILFDYAAYKKGHAKVLAERALYISAAADTLKNPDEVWINALSGLNQYVFIKYYTDEVIAVIAEIDKGKAYRVKTWFPIAETTKSTNALKRSAHKYKYRFGLLIKKPRN